jgi:hypothetical protein
LSENQFSKDLLSQGFDGGREAARQLHAQSYKTLNLTHATQLLIHVFANVTDLSFTLFLSGILPKPEVFQDFVNGFNSVGELITFVNVGRGKEFTDSKINGTLIRKVCLFRFNENVRCYATV